VNVSVNFVNTPPIAVNDSATVDEDGSVTITPLSNDSDADSHPLTLTSFSQPANGSLTDNGDGTLNYTPNENFNGTDSFTYTIDDGFGGTDTAIVSITVNPINDAPVAVGDSFATVVNEPLTIPVADVLLNDSDVDGDSLTVTAVSAGTNGAATLNPDDTISFTPNPDFIGTGSFTYTIDDGSGGTDIATVDIQVAGGGDFAVRTAELWEYQEWDINNPTWSGNPFDLDAQVTFQNQLTGETITTGMFYDNNDTWSFRFTGMELGTWTFTTFSSDTDLNGLTGTVIVDPNDDPNAYGFMTASSVDPRKWARMKGNEGEEEVFVPQLLMAGDVTRFADPTQIQADISTFIEGHGFNGFHVPEVAGQWFDFDSGNDDTTIAMQNPDFQTFVALENLINQSRQAGAVVHIWPWGDQARNQTPINLEGGINGVVDQRLQRYIAARLGPLPGWSMGYGFDLDEWVNETQLATWHDYMQSQLGWFHFLGARPEGPNFGLDHTQFNSWNDPQSYSSYEHHRPTYDVYVAAIETLPGQPTMSEDRFRIRTNSPFREKDYSPEDTRRGLWHSTMAGGVANIWGNYATDGNSENISEPYPNQAQIKTYSQFFFDNGRFLADMERANTLTDGVALKTQDNNNYVFYKEDTASIQVDLSGMSGSQRVIAVDALQAYSEIDLGVLAPGVHTINLPSTSDWAIAIGNFGNPTLPPTNVAPIASDDSYSTPSDTELVVDVNSGVLSNDSDANGDTLIISGFDANSTEGGVVTMANDGSFIYIPPTGYIGNDSFTYTIDDGNGETDTATVFIGVDFVNTPPVAGDDAIATNEDTPLAVTSLLLSNDSDDDGHSLAIASTTDPTNGSLSDDGSGLIYTPAPDFNGTDSFTYTITDGNGGTATASVTVTVNPVNDDPVANDDAFVTLESTSLEITATELLSNDSDIDGDGLTVTSVGSPANGTLTDNGNGSYTYSPNGGFTGNDSFNYTVNDGNGGTAIATVTITVDPQPPVNTDPIRFEAEAMTLTSDYQVQTGDFASNGALIGLIGATATASTSFTGATGFYDVVVGYFDESDGNSLLTVNVGGNTLDSWQFNNSPGGTRASADNFLTRTIATNVEITNGSLIEIIGEQDAGENSRTDYIEFIPVSAPAPDTVVPTASLTASSLAVNLGSTQNYSFTVTYSDNTSIDTSTLDSSDIRVLGPDGSDQLAQFVSVDNSTNGTPRTVTYSITPAGGSWDAGELGTYSVQLEPGQVTDLAGNAATGGTLGSFQIQDASSSDGTTADYSAAANGVILNLAMEVALSPVFGALDTPRIMPLGDSITAGDHSIGAVFGGYRTQFWTRAVTDGYSLDFVGGLSNGPSELGDKDHEGHRGDSIGQIRDNVSGWLSNSPADVILLMIGTNDAFGGADGPTLRDRLGSLIDEIAQVSPNTYLMVSSITPLDGPRSNDTQNAEVTEYNSLIPALVNDKVAEGKQVFYVNAGGSLTLSDMNGTNTATSPNNDGIHPTEDGYNALGDAWYDEVFNPESLTGKTRLVGSGFGDRLIGNLLNNTLEGGAGSDNLTGNGGADAFVYNSPTDGVDTITDFSSNDRIRIAAEGFDTSLAAGPLVNGSTFISGSNPTPTSTTATFLFNTDTSTLSFDPDGTDSGGAQDLITFTNGHTLQADQVEVFF
jgi:lysophospholipase L1-like esterase